MMDCLKKWRKKQQMFLDLHHHMFVPRWEFMGQEYLVFVVERPGLVRIIIHEVHK